MSLPSIKKNNLQLPQQGLTLKHLACQSSAIFELTYIKNTMQWIMYVFLYATESELLPSCGQMSSMLFHFVSWWELPAQIQSNFCHLPHQPLEQSALHKHLIIWGIYWVAASKLIRTAINLFHFTAQHHSAAWRLLSSFYCIIWKCVWNPWYLEAELVGGSASGLTKDYIVVSF